ncbi:hypothetical protein [Rhodanobacter sp. L36]|uniref:hypothetical protein n=1 Tax=Rhodanobacter sp. L36 TaxID=1747221 RepID=UPI00131C2A99|nr:hypothetical protein [Rhodanobacter sp. L36]
MPDTTVSPFGDEDPAEEAAAAAELAPAKTAAAVHAHLTALGVEPAVAALYQQRVASALSMPPPSAEEKATGIEDAKAELTAQYGNDATHIINLAHEEARLMARDNPQITDILRNTHLGYDTHAIKSLASRNLNRHLTSLGYRVDQ